MTQSDTQTFSAEERRLMVAEAAYYLAELRGFQDGECMTDWLQAEIDVERMLETSAPKTPAKRKPRTTTPKTSAATAKNTPEAL
jgi:hypothetical protein